MAKKRTSVDLYVNAVKRADREEEIRRHGKLISTRPARIVKSKKIYSRKGNKKNPDQYGSDFFLCVGFFIKKDFMVFFSL